MEAPPGFVSLFNGHDLKGWRGGDTFDHRELLAMSKADRERMIEKWSVELTPHWWVERGELVSNGVGRQLTTQSDFGDFELLAEYKIEKDGDSGIYLRGIPQVQLWDAGSKALGLHGANVGSGGLWNNKPGTPGREPLERADRPAGEWNTVRILMVGSRVSVWLNGAVVVNHAVLENFFDAARPVVSRGPIQLQTHGGMTWWRNLFIREIAAPEANEILSMRGRGEGFRSLWNGRDTTDWRGATSSFETFNGALRCKPGAAGVLIFHEELADFVVRMEFITAPGASAGLALRYPGEGDPATAGLCKIQMLDEHFEKKRGPIEARQRHGSAYGLVAALRGYQRPTGQWNFQEVTARGATVRVELNGYVIMESDLSTVTPAAYLRAGTEPWKIRPKGYLGIVGESAILGFRNLELRKLPTFAH